MVRRLDAQVSALKAAGAEKIFSEKQSGAKMDRAALVKALAALNAGDVLLVTRLDRLAAGTGARRQGDRVGGRSILLGVEWGSGWLPCILMIGVYDSSYRWP
jgi:Resolvase, N terminal domain